MISKTLSDTNLQTWRTKEDFRRGTYPVCSPEVQFQAPIGQIFYLHVQEWGFPPVSTEDNYFVMFVTTVCFLFLQSIVL